MARIRRSPPARHGVSPKPKPKTTSRAPGGRSPRVGPDREVRCSLQKILFSAPHCLLHLDESGRVIACNRVAETFLGAKARELRGRPLTSLLVRGEEEWEELRGLVRRAGCAEGHETLLITVGDGPVPVSLNVYAGALGGRGGRAELLVVARDLRPARAREDDASRRDQVLANILTDSMDAIIALDPEDRVLTWNRGAERLFGYEAEEMIGRPVHAIVPPDLLREGELAWLNTEVRRRGAVVGYETRRLARDGRELRVSITATVVREPHGGIRGRSAVIRDITETKNLHERLLQSERLAAIGTIASKVAHDIRNPLSSLLLNAELLDDELRALGGERAEEARGILRAVQAELDRLAGVTEDYLQFARPPRYRIELCQLNEIASGLLELLQSQLARGGVVVRCDLDAHLPEIMADREQLRRALLNLLRNAIEAMPRGGNLTIATRAEVHEVVITVADTGVGIDRDDLERVFAPFFSTKQGGTGLGLAVARQIVTDHGGRLDCQSVADEGAVFTVRLPRHPRKEGRRLAGEVISRGRGGFFGPDE